MGLAVEHDLSVKHRWPLFILLLGVVNPLVGFAMDCPLLVVAARSAPIDYLSRQEIRRLYLGVPLQVEGGTLQPVRNTSDTMLQEVFLQKILAMSKNAYRRVLAARLVRLREPGPAEARDIDKLIQMLLANPYLVSYLWKSDFPENNELKILLEVPCVNN